MTEKKRSREFLQLNRIASLYCFAKRRFPISHILTHDVHMDDAKATSRKGTNTHTLRIFFLTI